MIRSSGRLYEELVMGVLREAKDLVIGVSDVFTSAAAVLELTDYADACPIETVALEVSSTNESLRIACAEVFESWIAAGTALHTDAGVGRKKGRELTIILITALEGAFVLARAMRSTEPLIAAGRGVVAVVEKELGSAAKR